MKVEVIRSQRRVKTLSARVVDGVIQVRAPAHLSDAELAPMIEQLKAKLERRAAKAKLDDAALERRAQALNRACFDGALEWRSIRWVTNQGKRYGSCTTDRGTIRISHRVAEMPAFVRDYVIVHELAHLQEPHHGATFWALVNRYPRAERARGYLMALGLEPLEE
ncbi:MAG: M48 family metallopeptidase [Anaerolineae bacterium]|nr:M48 family metallopeptidase [Anaerolineae bacterium]